MILEPSLNMQFNPQAWTPYLSTSFCFAYAANEPRLAGANIGGLNGTVPDWRTEQSIQDIDLVIARGVKDGFISVDERDFNPSEEHVFATLTGVLNYETEEYDCHHIRIDSIGEKGEILCSDKPGRTPPKQIIGPPDQRLSEHLFNKYSKGVQDPTFIGFFKIPNKGIPAHPRFD